MIKYLKCLRDANLMTVEKVEEMAGGGRLVHEDVIVKARGLSYQFARGLVEVTIEKFMNLDLPSPGLLCLGTIYNPTRQQCNICLEDVHVGSLTARMSCKHVFHEPCLLSWLKSGCAMANYCPKCRTIMDEGRLVTLHLIDSSVL